VFQGYFEAMYVEVRIGGYFIPSAVSQVDLFIGVYDEVVDGVVAVVVVEPDVDAVHLGDAGGNILVQELSEF